MTEDNNDIKEASLELVKLSVVETGSSSYNELLQAIAERINDLINHNFSELVQLLYRLDISENKLKALLKDEHEDASQLIAKLIIERQLVKIKTRRSFKRNDNISDEEKW